MTLHTHTIIAIKVFDKIITQNNKSKRGQPGISLPLKAGSNPGPSAPKAEIIPLDY